MMSLAAEARVELRPTKTNEAGPVARAKAAASKGATYYGAFYSWAP